MSTIPTGRLERELRALYLRWLNSLTEGEDMLARVEEFEQASRELIESMGGRVAMRGALADFPVPELLDLSPRAGIIYDSMKQAAIQAGILTGLQATEVARQMFQAGMDKSFNRLNRLARTETVSAYWKNAFDSIADLPGLVMVWGAERGPRTCQWCLDRDGLVMASPDIRDHPNGRCTPIPMLRSDVEYRGSVRADGDIYMDPAWSTSNRRIEVPVEEAPQVLELDGKDPRSMTAQERVSAVEDMFGTDSRQHKAAQELLNRKPPSVPKSKPPVRPKSKTRNPLSTEPPVQTTRTQSYNRMTGEDKIKAAEVMYGRGSAQHRAAIKRWRKK